MKHRLKRVKRIEKEGGNDFVCLSGLVTNPGFSPESVSPGHKSAFLILPFQPSCVLRTSYCLSRTRSTK